MYCSVKNDSPQSASEAFDLQLLRTFLGLSFGSSEVSCRRPKRIDCKQLSDKQLAFVPTSGDSATRLIDWEQQIAWMQKQTCLPEASPTLLVRHKTERQHGKDPFGRG